MKCYATIVTTESYFPGVKLLRDSLKKTGTKYELKIFISEALYNKLLLVGDYKPEELVKYHFDFKLDNELSEINANSDNPQWSCTFDKLILFSHTEYEKIVYLDCDMEVKSNIDDLFDRPHMAAVNPSVGNSDYMRGFNSGLMVIVPEKGLDRKILALLTTKEIQRLTSVSDNDLLQLYYNAWGKDINQILPDEYNVYFPNIDNYKKIEKIKVLHYIGSNKPWMNEK